MNEDTFDSFRVLKNISAPNGISNLEFSELRAQELSFIHKF